MTIKNSIKLVATDLDGTLLRDNKSISDSDYHSLQYLKDKGIYRVAATGRSLHKVNEVLDPSVPLDYLVFSSGAGIYDWKNRSLLHSEYFDVSTTNRIINHLVTSDLNFFVYQPIPHNNLFEFYRGADQCHEFEDYMFRHAGDFKELVMDNYAGYAGQFMAVISNETDLFIQLKKEIEAECNNVRVIRTTSPINQKYTWLEIFPEAVSKGHGLKWLCDYLLLDYKTTLGVGNDYNDLDMFEFVGHPYVIGNGIEELKSQFHTIEETNNEDGFSKVIQKLID